MRINIAVPEAHVEAPVLDAALESVTRLNQAMLARGEIPSFDEAKKRGIKWQPEPPGAEHFDHAKTVLARKNGDCDDMAPYAAASMRHSGEDPGATAIVRRSGPKTWHAVVQRSDGSIRDPSRETGMGSNNARGVVGAGLPRMIGQRANSVSGAYIIRPQIAMRPVRGAYQARADLPWHWREHLEDKPSPTDYAMTTLHTAPVAHTALVGALDGACELAIAGGYADPEHIDRLCCIADAVEGVPFRELAGIYGEEHARAAHAVVGSFFGTLAKGLKNVVAPIASKALQFVPGVGPLASTALDMGMKLIPSSKPSAPAPATAQARQPLSAPVIVRAPSSYQPPAVTAQPSYRPPGAAATQNPLGRLRPGGIDLLRTLIFE